MFSDNQNTRKDREQLSRAENENSQLRNEVNTLKAQLQRAQNQASDRSPSRVSELRSDSRSNSPTPTSEPPNRPLPPPKSKSLPVPPPKSSASRNRSNTIKALPPTTKKPQPKLPPVDSAKAMPSVPPKKAPVPVTPATNSPPSRPNLSKFASSPSIQVPSKPSSSQKPGGGAEGSPNTMRVKCVYKDTRVVVVPIDVSFQELTKEIANKFQQNGLIMRYKDEDGDMCTVASDDDLHLAMKGLNGDKLQLQLTDFL